MKFNPTKSALSALLLLGSALTHATPTVESDPLDSLWQWLFAPTPQAEPVLLCPDFPACPPPAASEQTPEQQSSTKGDD